VAAVLDSYHGIYRKLYFVPGCTTALTCDRARPSPLLLPLPRVVRESCPKEVSVSEGGPTAVAGQATVWAPPPHRAAD
jgi:hypothetical protein